MRRTACSSVAAAISPSCSTTTSGFMAKRSLAKPIPSCIGDHVGEDAVDRADRLLQRLGRRQAAGDLVGDPDGDQFAVVLGQEAVAAAHQPVAPGEVVGDLAVVDDGDIRERPRPERMAGIGQHRALGRQPRMAQAVACRSCRARRASRPRPSAPPISLMISSERPQDWTSKCSAMVSASRIQRAISFGLADDHARAIMRRIVGDEGRLLDEIGAVLPQDGPEFVHVLSEPVLVETHASQDVSAVAWHDRKRQSRSKSAPRCSCASISSTRSFPTSPAGCQYSARYATHVVLLPGAIHVYCIQYPSKSARTWCRQFTRLQHREYGIRKTLNDTAGSRPWP